VCLTKHVEKRNGLNGKKESPNSAWGRPLMKKMVSRKMTIVLANKPATGTSFAFLSWQAWKPCTSSIKRQHVTSREYVRRVISIFPWSFSSSSGLYNLSLLKNADWCPTAWYRWLVLGILRLSQVCYPFPFVITGLCMITGPGTKVRRWWKHHDWEISWQSPLSSNLALLMTDLPYFVFVPGLKHISDWA